MKKILLMSVLALVTSFNSSAQEQKNVEVLFTGTPWGVQNVSQNNRYICGTRMYEEIYRYDIQERKLITVPGSSSYSAIAALDVTNDGVLVGCGDVDNKELPAIYKDGEWTYLPIPDGDIEGSANQVTGDGKTIAGLVWGSTIDKPYEVLPTIWNLREDGSYELEVLPNPETDFIGGKTQFVSPRSISDDGKTIVGVMVEQHGKYYATIVWRKGEDGLWKYETPLLDYCYNVEKYQELSEGEPQIADFAENPKNPKWSELTKYYVALAEWNYKFLTGFMTGKMFSPTPVVLSADGTYLALASQTTKYSYEEGSTDVNKDTSAPYPTLYNLNTKELTELPEVEGFEPFGVSNYGDMIYSDGYKFYILLHGEKEYVDVADWLKDDYSFDLKSLLPDNTEYVECEAVAGDMSLLAGNYISVTPEGGLDKKEVFVVLMPNLSTMIETLNTPENTHISISGNNLCFGNDVKDVRMFNIAGHEVFRADVVNGGIDVSAVGRGVYVVSATFKGNVIRGKVLKK